MQPRHLLLALTVVFVWGINFVIIKVGLRQVSPLTLGVARFVLAVFPWIFFVPRPEAPLRLIALYGLFTFALQFGLLFTGMKVGMSAGLASLLMQLQVFFTIGLAVPLLGQRPTLSQAAGALLAFAGIGVVAANVGGEVTLQGLLLIIGAAAAWAAGNIVSRMISNQYGSDDMMSLVIWGSLFAVPPLLAVTLAIEPDAFVRSLTQLDWASIGAIAYLVYLSTLFAFAAWSWLLSRYPVATVAPFTLLVPVFGFLGAAVLLNEPLEAWKLSAGALVVAGLVVNLSGGRLARALGSTQK